MLLIPDYISTPTIVCPSIHLKGKPSGKNNTVAAVKGYNLLNNLALSFLLL